MQEVLQRLAHFYQLHLLGWFDGALRSGQNGSVGLHFQAVLGETSGCRVRFKLLSASFLLHVESAYLAEFYAAGRLINRRNEFISALVAGRGDLLRLAIPTLM